LVGVLKKKKKKNVNKNIECNIWLLGKNYNLIS